MYKQHKDLFCPLATE